MASISSLGISGLPLDQLLTDIRKSENQALALIQDRQKAAETKLSAYGKLKDSVSALQKAAETIGKADTFGTSKVSTGSEAISAKAGTNAIAGNYNVKVNSLATSQTLVYAGQTDRDAAIGSGGTLKITIDGEVKELDLSGGTSLNDIMKAINNDKDIGVDATIVNDGSDEPFRLLLTNRETGVANAATKIEVDGNNELNNFLAFDADDPGANAGISVQNATDANLEINGIEITSATNTIKDVIDGVELTLNETTDEAVSLKVAKDNDATKKAISSFVSAYNSMLDTIKSLTSYDVENQQASALTGDSLARNIQSRIHGAINGGFDPASGTNLSQIGITTDPKTGEFKIDDKLLDKALADNPEGVKALFSSETGIGKSVTTAAESFTRSGGVFTIQTDGLNTTIKNIQKQYETAAARIDQRMDMYQTQFSQLDAMVSQMNSLSGYLMQQFDALNSINSQSRK